MNLVWWILPAISGVIGLMLVFAGFAKVLGLKPFSGGTRLFFGAGFLGLAGVVAFAGLNLQTYRALTKEREVVTISFEAAPTAETYTATLIYPGGDTDRFELSGDEWNLNARVIKFQPFSNMLGYDSVYKLDRLYGRYEDVGRADETVGVRLNANPGLDVRELARQHGGRFGIQDASYGSGVYNPMADGLAYRVYMTQNALIARSANAATRARVGEPNNPIAAPTAPASHVAGPEQND